MLGLAILVCALALIGLLVFMGVPDMVMHPPVAVTYTPTPTPAAVVRTKRERPVARISEFATVDRFALDAPAEMESEVRVLANYLRGGARGERERVRSVYRWVCDRIAYDGDSYRDHLFPDTDAAYTLKRKKAICGGYARLLHELGRACGLQMEMVVGDARGSTLSQAGATERHAWNAVRLDSKWYLLDPTWGSGSVDDDFVYEKNFNEAYFLIAPEQLRFSHFPDKQSWQLCDQPLTRAQFLEQPVLTPAFFKLGLSWKRLPPLHLKDVHGLEISMAHRVDLQAALLPAGGEPIEGATLVSYVGSTARILIAPPRPGRYRLALMGAEWEDESSQDVAEFELVARRAVAMGYPEQTEVYVQRHVNLLQPVSARLKPGLYRFRLEAPDAVRVTCAGVALTQKGDLFEGDVSVHSGTVSVRAEFEPGEMETLLSYEIAE